MNAREKSRVEAIVRVAVFGSSPAENWTPVPQQSPPKRKPRQSICLTN
jgi:hypothetical protein